MTIMDTSVLAGAISGVIIAITGLIGAITVLLSAIRKSAAKTDAAIAENTATTNITHDLVNSHADLNTVRLDQLENALTDSGVDIPKDPAVAVAQKRVDQAREGDNGRPAV